MLGMSERTFRRWTSRYEAGRLEGLRDRRSSGGSHRRAPDAEVAALEGTCSRLGGGVREGIAAKGIFASLYTDRGSHYWYTPRAGGKVDRGRPEPGGRWGSWGSR